MEGEQKMEDEVSELRVIEVVGESARRSGGYLHSGSKGEPDREEKGASSKDIDIVHAIFRLAVRDFTFPQHVVGCL